jgi:hypothetical protein
VVDENAGDLKQYGLEPAKVEVEFRAKGDKEPRKLQLGEKTPTGGDLYARFPTQKRVFLVSSFVDSTFNKNAFALRDKTIIKIDREKVGSHRNRGRQAIRHAGQDRHRVADRRAADGSRRFRRHRRVSRTFVVGPDAGHRAG